MPLPLPLYAYYTARPELIPAGTPSDQVFPHFIVSGLPTGITGFVVAAIVAAGMSTIATSINSAATVVLTDFVKRLSKTELSDKQSMKTLYITSFLVGFIGGLIGLLMMKVNGVLDAWWKLASICSGGMLGLFLLALMKRRASKGGAIVAVVVGLLVIAWMSLSPLLPENDTWAFVRSSLHGYLTIVFGTMSIFVVGFILTLFASKRTKK